MAKKTAILLIADGSEEMEAVITADILRRAGVRYQTWLIISSVESLYDISWTIKILYYFFVIISHKNIRYMHINDNCQNLNYLFVLPVNCICNMKILHYI